MELLTIGAFSRASRLSPKALRLYDSLGLLLDEGKITPEEADSHPQRSLLLRAITADQAAEPDVSLHEARAGDRYLLCSDGLTTVISAGAIGDALSAPGDPEQAVAWLIDLANEADGPDNIACVVADVIEPPSGLP